MRFKQYLPIKTIWEENNYPKQLLFFQFVASPTLNIVNLTLYIGSSLSVDLFVDTSLSTILYIDQSRSINQQI